MGRGKMKKYMTEWIVLVMTLCCALLCAVLLSFYTKASLVSKKDPLLFGATYMTMNNPFYEVIDEELHNQVEANGDVMITMDPQLSVERQIDQIHVLMDRGIDVLIVNPVDSRGLVDVLKETKQQGISIIAIDTNVYDGEDFIDYTVVSDNYQAGVLCAQYMMKHKEAADIVLLSHEAANSAVERLQGFRDTVRQHDGYRIVAELDCEGQLEKSMPLIEGLFAENVKFDVIMALNDPAALGAVAALQEQGVEKKEIMVLGVDGAPEAKVLIKEGYMDGTVAQYPKKMAQLAIQAAYQLRAGEQDLQEEKIDVDMINESNIDEYLLEGWQ